METSITNNDCDEVNNGIKLLDAVMEGRANDAVELLRIDPSLIHIADPIGDTPLHLAARAGNGLMLKKMINCLVRDHLCEHNDDPGMVKDVLLECNAQERTPLCLAIMNDHIKAARYIVIADPRCWEKERKLLSFISRRLPYVRLKYKKIIDEFDKRSATYIMLQNNKNFPVLPLFIKEYHEVTPWQPLELYLSKGFATVDIQMRLARSISFDIHGEYENRLRKFDQAIEAGTKDKISAMLKKDPMILNYKYQVEKENRLRKFDQAIEAGREDEISAMLKKDLTLLEYKNYQDMTALHCAAYNGWLGPLKIMIQSLEYDAEINRRLVEGDAEDKTPLFHAIERGHEEVALYLAKVAPRAIFKTDIKKRSPLDWAVEKGFSDLVRYMINKTNFPQPVREGVYDCAKKIPIAHFAVRNKKPAMLQAILEELPEAINFHDKKTWTVLSYAASKNYFKEFSYILKSFPNSARNIDGDGSYPIHKAVAPGHVNIVKEFLLHCPEARQDTDRKGRNLIEVATLYGRNDVITYLNGINNNEGEKDVDVERESISNVVI